MTTHRIGLALIALATITGTPVATAAPDTADYEYCRYLSDMGYRNADCGSSKMLSIGSCRHFADGKTWRDAMDTAMAFTRDVDFSRYVVAGGVAFYCPQFESRIMGNG